MDLFKAIFDESSSSEEEEEDEEKKEDSTPSGGASKISATFPATVFIESNTTEMTDKSQPRGGSRWEPRPDDEEDCQITHQGEKWLGNFNLGDTMSWGNYPVFITSK